MADSPYRDAFATALRQARERRGLTRRELARASGVSERSLVNYENGTNEPPLTQAARLAYALGLTLDGMLAGVVDADPPNDDDRARSLLEESIRLQQIALLDLDTRG